MGGRDLLRRSREKKEISRPRRICRECGEELEGYPEDVDICSRCHERMEERKREILFLGRIRLIGFFLA
jgi:predicted amidophosphoribosyltransferase